ncbi:MAG: hypothetical protein ACRC14_13150, partial [Paracoccaceae bacterium]
LPLSNELSTLGPKAKLPDGYRLSQRCSEYRLNFIKQGVEAPRGGSMAGAGLVDIACNWGGFSIEAHLRGASRVMGFDIRAEDISFRVQDLFTH